VYQWCGFKSRRGKNKNLTALKSNSNTVWFNFQTYIYIYIHTKICKLISERCGIAAFVSGSLLHIYEKQTTWRCNVINYLISFVYIYIYNISAISWRSVLLVEKTGVPKPVWSLWQTLSVNVVSSTSRHQRIQTHNFRCNRHWSQPLRPPWAK
jgi:hypothetical protein